MSWGHDRKNTMGSVRQNNKKCCFGNEQLGFSSPLCLVSCPVFVSFCVFMLNDWLAGLTNPKDGDWTAPSESASV